MAQSQTEADDGEAGMNHRFSTVNDNRVELWGQSAEYDQAARRLAADLPRDMDGLSAVEGGVPGQSFADASFRLESADTFRRTEIPDGWSVLNVGQHGNGSMFVDLQRTEADR